MELDEDPELARLRHLLDHPAECPGDTARELYSGLLDRYGEGHDELRALAARLHELEREGVLPRSMVVRTRRR